MKRNFHDLNNFNNYIWLILRIITLNAIVTKKKLKKERRDKEKKVKLVSTVL